MKTMVWPSSCATSFSTAFSRSSNSPRYLAPASSSAMSSTSTRLLFSDSGTSPATMRCARPSTIAVLPTPGSPISTGLFLVRRCSTWMARRISSSRPITGSSLPWRARSVRSMRVLLQRLALAFGLGAVDLLAAAHRVDRGLQRLARQAVAAGDAAEVGLARRRAPAGTSRSAMNWSPRLAPPSRRPAAAARGRGRPAPPAAALHLGQACRSRLPARSAARAR